MPVGALVASQGSARQRVRAVLDPEIPPTPVPSSITVTPTPFSVAEGATVQLTATVYDQLGQEMVGEAVTWASSASGTASVNASTGLVTGVASGSCTITATASNGTNLSTGAACTVSPAVVASVDLTPTSLALTVGGGTATFTAQPRDASGNALAGRTVEAPSSDTNLATTSVSGYTVTVTPVAAGSPTVTATCETIASPTRTVTVTAAGAHPHEPGGATQFTLLDDVDYPSVEGAWGTNGNGKLAVVAKASVSFAGVTPRAASTLCRKSFIGVAAGSSGLNTYKTGIGTSHFYLDFDYAWGADFVAHTSRVNKVFFIKGDGASGGNPGYLSYRASGTGTGKLALQIQGAVPGLGGNDTSGSRRLDGVTTIPRDTWVRILLRIKLNTFNAADGEVEMWVDVGSGLVQQFSATNCAFRGTGSNMSSAGSDIDALHWDPTFGGTAASTSGGYHYLGYLYGSKV